jgi:hypothetical protein
MQKQPLQNYGSGNEIHGFNTVYHNDNVVDLYYDIVK